MSASLEELQEQIDQELQRLSPKQRKFALIYGQGNHNQQDAYRSAGYAPTHASNNAYAVRKKAATAMQLIQRKHALENGQSASEYRQKLINLHNLCAAVGSPSWEPRTAHSVLRTLMELDGHIKNTGTSGVSVSIELVDPVAGITIDSDTYGDSAAGVAEGEFRSVTHDTSENTKDSGAE